MPTDGDGSADIVERRTALSGSVDYSTPVTLHDSREMRITAVPFYVPRSSGEEMSVKLIRETKSRAGFRRARPDAEISLSGSATINLRDCLNSWLALLGQTSGRHLVVPLQGEATELEGHDPAAVAEAVVALLSRPEILRRLGDLRIAADVANALQAGLRVLDLRTALDELRELLGSEVVDEATYQRWCEQHAWVFGGAYLDPDQTRLVALGDQVDLLMPLVVNGLRDIIELKRPDAEVLRWDSGHRNWHWSIAVAAAIGQVDRYLERLELAVSTGQLRDHPEIQAHRPRALVVIGRSLDWDTEQAQALHALNGRLHGIAVQTYDHLLKQGERMLELQASSAPNSEDG